jgi:5'-nucleotidase (lipoprotein e(P4) family)
MFTYAKFVRVIVLTSLLFLPGHLSAQTSTSPQSVNVNEHETYAVLWTQSAAEYRALALQAFNLARLRLDQDLAQHSRRRAKRPAIIVDADETVLDNSRFQAELILRNVGYTAEAWTEWVNRAEAGAVPGALEFLNYAFRRGARVFYITNRRQTEKAGTVANLKKLGFPDVSEDTVMIREQGSTSSKESRRKSVRSLYRVVLLVGDNLNDFNDDFAGKSIADRKAQVDREQAEFGTQYIVIPNPMYGDWENAIYGNAKEKERPERRRAALRGITIQPGP